MTLIEFFLKLIKTWKAMYWKGLVHSHKYKKLPKKVAHLSSTTEVQVKKYYDEFIFSLEVDKC